MKPGDLVRNKHNMFTSLWMNIALHRDTGRYSMKKETGKLEGLAMVVAVPRFAGAGTKAGAQGAVLLFTHDMKLRWTWANSLMVV